MRRSEVRRRSVACELLVVGIWAIAGVPASSSTIEVTTSELAVAEDGACTLVEAIHAANADVASGSAPGECPAGNGADVIELPHDVYALATIESTLDGSNGLPSIASEIEIRGHDSTIERVATAPPMRILHVSETGALTLRNLVLRGGNQPSGGTIYSRGALELDQTVITDSSGDAIRVENAALTMRDGAVSGTAGGCGVLAVLDGHPLRIERCRIDANGASGVLVHDGHVTIVDSEISENIIGVWLFGGQFDISGTAIARNGRYGLSLYPGSYDDGASGSLRRSALHDNGDYALDGYVGGTVTVADTTIAHNAREGAVLELGTYDIAYTTIVDNHYAGLIRWSAIVRLEGTIIADQQSGPDCRDEFPSPPFVLRSLGHNLDSDGTCRLLEPTDLPGVDPGLGGPALHCGATITYAPGPTSPALDAIDAVSCSAAPIDGVDQRGFPRPSDGDLDGSALCDIGALEVQRVDDDHDAVPADGDDSCVAGDHPCPDGTTTGCDDNCSEVSNPGQEDGDGDGVGTACDNCPSDANSPQTDLDLDGEGDLCDRDDGLVYLTFPQSDRVVWQDEIGVDAFHLYRGDLGVLRASGEYTQDPNAGPLVDRWCGETGTALTDAYVPPGSSAAFFLLGPVVNGVEGSLGPAPDGNERPNDHPCPAP